MWKSNPSLFPSLVCFSTKGAHCPCMLKMQGLFQRQFHLAAEDQLATALVESRERTACSWPGRERERKRERGRQRKGEGQDVSFHESVVLLSS